MRTKSKPFINYNAFPIDTKFHMMNNSTQKITYQRVIELRIFLPEGDGNSSNQLN